MRTLFLICVLTAGLFSQSLTIQPRMGEPLNGLTATDLQRFNIGAVQFNRTFAPTEGLGPIFNQNSCASCHNNPVGGSGGILVTRFGFDDPKAGGFDPLGQLGGSLLQSQTISIGCQETLPPSANVVAQRRTTSLLGIGLVEAIPDADLIANALATPGGVTGGTHMVPLLENPAAPLRVGRFGWKAQLATVLSFSGDATLEEMGITNRLVASENAPNGDQGVLASCDTVSDPEDGPGMGMGGNGRDFIDEVTDFQRYLAPPPQTPQSGMAGEVIFNTVGCANCHTASWTTSSDPGLEPALRGQTIRPYSDFLLHDMGQTSDFIVQGGAGRQEMRTPALWGLRVRNPIWHDGRVTDPSFSARILGPGGIIDLHDAFGSEASPSAQAFKALSGPDQDAVVAFLDSLGRAEFDADGDGRVVRSDLEAFLAAETGPGSFFDANDPRAVFDWDQDGDIDNTDFDALVVAYQEDCNANGIGDLIDITVNGTSNDVNGNWIPDECETCQTDLGGGTGTLTITVCGDDLTQPGSSALGVIQGAPASSTVWLAISLSMSPMPFGTSGMVIPSLPFDLFMPLVTDTAGTAVIPVGGGGPLRDLFVQAAYVNGPLVELSNAVQITMGQ